jgi:hypothetical protein
VQVRPSAERKVGKVGYEDHYRLRDELEVHLVKLKKQIQEVEDDCHQSK